MQRTMNNSDKKVYQTRTREIKMCVAQARKTAFEEWSEDMNTMEGRNKLLRVAAQVKRDKVDI